MADLVRSSVANGIILGRPIDALTMQEAQRQTAHLPSSVLRRALRTTRVCLVKRAGKIHLRQMIVEQNDSIDADGGSSVAIEACLECPNI
jgi:hypothetical protein